MSASVSGPPFDMLTSEFAASAHKQYRAMLSAGPIYERAQVINGVEIWMVLGYEEGRRILGDDRFARDEAVAERTIRQLGIQSPQQRSLLTSDPPDHTRLRRVVRPAFTTSRIERLRPRATEVAHLLLNAIAPQGEVDLIETFTLPLPFILMGEWLGLPEDERDRQWLRAREVRSKPVDSNVHLTAEERATTVPGTQGERARLADIVATRRPQVHLSLAAEDQPDVISLLIAAADGQGKLSDDEVLDMISLLIIAGFETTAVLLANGLVALSSDPNQAAVLGRHPEILRQAIEEFLRFEPPLENSNFLIAKEDVSIGDVVIPQGSLVTVAVAAANRDPRRFENSDQLNILRPLGHLSFGYGPHFCLGAPLARMLAEVAFAALLERLPGLELACGPEDLPWRDRSQPNLMARDLESLPVRFTPTPLPRQSAAAG